MCSGRLDRLGGSRRVCDPCVLDDVGENRVQVALGRPADRVLDLPDRRLAVERVLDPLVVDLVVRDEGELGAAGGRAENTLRTLEDRGPPRPPPPVELPPRA